MNSKIYFDNRFVRFYSEDGIEYKITVRAEIKSLFNQTPYFSITAVICEKRRGVFVEYMGGCLHDGIAKHVPEVKKYICWHLVGLDEPMHYILNSLYWAGLLGWTDSERNSPPNFKYLKDTCKWD